MLKEQIQNDLKQAMRDKDETTLSTLRLLTAAFNNLEISKRGEELTDKDYQAVIKREVKKRQEAAEAFKLAGRAESQAKEEAELAILAKFLPEEMSEQAVKAIVDAVVEEKGATANLGLIIGEVMKRADGRADGGLVSKLVKEKLG